ncbi:YiiX/YebB-like N1pC/P60 family cysteine hydrolase [Salinithrix halophila]|uniref:YiiX/YebB-like N1pC/P60 family cysteine hydrolase n=1 Tax=Salinithrix halophila TaxID=1485204 RepID=A0ABV8JM78_9BACL
MKMKPFKWTGSLVLVLALVVGMPSGVFADDTSYSLEEISKLAESTGYSEAQLIEEIERENQANQEKIENWSNQIDVQAVIEAARLKGYDLKEEDVLEDGGLARPSQTNGDVGVANLDPGVGTYGDILYTPDTGTKRGYFTGHAGMVAMDDDNTWESYSTADKGGVIYDVNRWRWDYEKAQAYWVKDATSTDYDYASKQKGEPYNVMSSKETTDEWYCSKLVWRSWKNAKGINLDPDPDSGWHGNVKVSSGNYWVSTADLGDSPHTITYWSKGY